MSENKMEKVTYESPKFEFEEMILTEKVAYTCWGYAYAWYDVDGNGKIDGNEKVNLSSLGLGKTGCQGNNAETALKEYFKNNFGVTLSAKDVSPSTQSPIITGSYS